jgi:hypothetical protein
MNTLEVNGKAATTVMLHCPLLCGEFVEDAMLIYISKEHNFVIYGRCGMCEQFSSVTISLIQIMSHAPCGVVM